jgi:hypothetical protein
MSGGDPGQEAGASIGRASAELQRIFANLALPAIQQAASAYQADLGQPGQVPASVTRAFGEAREAVGRDFDTSNARGRATIQQASLQSGMGHNPAAISEASERFVEELEGARTRRMRALQFAEAQAGQNQTNYLLSQLIGQGGGLLGGSLGFGQNALQGAGLLSQAFQQQSNQWATYGGMAGSVLGGAFGGPFGAAIGGGVGGAAGGYLGSR